MDLSVLRNAAMIMADKASRAMEPNLELSLSLAVDEDDDIRQARDKNARVLSIVKDLTFMVRRDDAIYMQGKKVQDKINYLIQLKRVDLNSQQFVDPLIA
jgi:hypothetical protein